MNIEYFQLVDRIESLDPERGLVTCAATVPKSSTIFEGHFPGHPLMPGTLLIESMAQSSGYMLLARFQFEPYAIFNPGWPCAEFGLSVEPGDELTVNGVLEHDGSGFAVTKGEILRGEERIADAELRFRTMAFPTEALRDIVREYASRLGLAP